MPISSMDGGDTITFTRDIGTPETATTKSCTNSCSNSPRTGLECRTGSHHYNSVGHFLLREDSFFPGSPENPMLTSIPSLEMLVPSLDCHSRKTSLLAATFNLVATIVGGGVLSLPLSFSRAGLVWGTVLMIIAALITDFSLYILCEFLCIRWQRDGHCVQRREMCAVIEISFACVMSSKNNAPLHSG